MGATPIDAAPTKGRSGPPDTTGRKPNKSQPLAYGGSAVLFRLAFRAVCWPSDVAFGRPLGAVRSTRPPAASAGLSEALWF
ncbi:hypothetical protein L3i22_039580 [Actinoplanes sp. L3-i22]|nr:hypothetical protein L3i22_039580 [Actinoplanes sp. L3-i22]